MFENITKFLKKFNKKEKVVASNSKEAAKERLHLVLMQDRANVSADFLELMKQEIIEVIKKYIDVDENAIDVRLTNKENADGTNGAPALYANIPILNIKNEARKVEKDKKEEQKENEIEKVENEENKKENNDTKQTEKVEQIEKDEPIENNKEQKENKKEKNEKEKESKKEKIKEKVKTEE